MDLLFASQVGTMMLCSFTVGTVVTGISEFYVDRVGLIFL